MPNMCVKLTVNSYSTTAWPQTEWSNGWENIHLIYCKELWHHDSTLGHCFIQAASTLKPVQTTCIHSQCTDETNHQPNVSHTSATAGVTINIFNKSYGTMHHVRSGKNTRDTRGYKPKPRYEVSAWIPPQTVALCATMTWLLLCSSLGRCAAKHHPLARPTIRPYKV